MLHAEIGYEEKEFALNDVIKNLNKKIINRHPYIFNKKEKVSLKKITTDLGKYKKFRKRSTSYEIFN